MNWAWATSLDQLWRSPAFPMWLTLAAAGFFGIIVLITLLRAEKSVANGALTVITLLAIGIAVAASLRGFGSGNGEASAEARLGPTTNASLPALSCIDDLAGEPVLLGCEKALFGSAESAAAAVSYAASQITRLTALAAGNGTMPFELQALRRAVEHDRYGLMAQVLLTRDRCTPSDCAFFRVLTDPHQIMTNMDVHVYDGLISRYAPLWNAQPWNAPAPAAATPIAVLPPSLPTGKPTNAEFPTAASTPAVSIMTPEPGPPAAPHPPAANGPLPSPRPAQAMAPALAAAKKQPAPKQPPRQLTPAQPAPGQPAPAAANE